ncbi:hypothetical protein [Salana multivorans]
MADKLAPGERRVAPSFLGGCSAVSIFEGSDNKDAWEFIEPTTTGDLATSWRGVRVLPRRGRDAATPRATILAVAPVRWPENRCSRAAARSPTPAVGQTEGAKLVERMLQNVSSVPDGCPAMPPRRTPQPR